MLFIKDQFTNCGYGNTPFVDATVDETHRYTSQYKDFDWFSDLCYCFICI